MTVELHFLCDISIVVTAHAEGRLAHRTMRSIQEAIVEAEESGLRTEIIIVLDSPSDETLDYFARWREGARVLEVSKNDPGLSRNAGTEVARGKYIAIVDADDLLGKSWLRLAFQRAEQVPLLDFIVHAEYTIFFENWNAVAHHQASDATGYRKLNLLTTCIWTSVMFAPRSTFRKIPFLATSASSGFGYEDWHWICNVLAAGGEVLIADRTCKFTRYKSSGSQLKSYDSRHALIHPTALFDPRRNDSSFPPSSTSEDSENTTGPTSVSPSTLFTSIRDRCKSVLSYVPQLPRFLSVAERTFNNISEYLARFPVDRVVFPKWLDEELRQISNIEPELFPTSELLASMEMYKPEAGRIVEPYGCLCNEMGNRYRDVIGPQFTYVYLVPGLKRGRADLVALKSIQEVVQQRSMRILVIATDSSDSSWIEVLPKSVTFLDYWKWSNHLNIEQRSKLLAVLLVQCQPNVIHNIDSITAHQSFTTYGRALSQVSRLFSEVFFEDIPCKGKKAGLGLLSIVDQQECLSAILTENQHVLTYLEETYGIDPTKLVLHC